ncbi:membrane protein [Caballeronia udeis]|uniref:Membrane protein n=1 Tax=Caballeronia udeis TaxID=1232866 RepID=A0A158H387_9BURK|nr:lysylphosphatidylglycerol synthase domain-containing protein [Caballeronia udeis]SAL38792.1 membrane protein [Caballeronia udeis]
MTAALRWLAWARWPLAIGLLSVFAVHEGFADVLRGIRQAGITMLWLVPFHALPLLLDACGWRVLLGRLAPLPVLWWIATVRESVSRLLPAAGVGGELVGIRLAHWYVADVNRVSASVIVEVLVTVVVQYAFSALGLLLLVATTHAFAGVRLIGLALLLSSPVPIVFFILVRSGGLFQALERHAARWLGPSRRFLSKLDGARLDREIDALMQRPGLLACAFAWQLGGYMLGSLEVYWALAFFGHPVSIASALAVEALTQAVRHAAFFMPAGLGVQEAAIMVLAHMAGVDRQAGIALALVKRMREVLFGCIALAAWQVAELRRNGRNGRSRLI